MKHKRDGLVSQDGIGSRDGFARGNAGARTGHAHAVRNWRFALLPLMLAGVAACDKGGSDAQSSPSDSASAPVAMPVDAPSDQTAALDSLAQDAVNAGDDPKTGAPAS